MTERALNKMRAARFDAVALARRHGDSLTPEQVDLVVGHVPQDEEHTRRFGEQVKAVMYLATTHERCPTCGGTLL